MKITSKTINYTVETVEELSTIVGQENDVIVVTDENRGGTFVYRSAEVGINNSGTVFDGWVRQYDGAVNVKWFGAKGDGITDDTVAIQNAIDVKSQIGSIVFAPSGNYLIAGNGYIDIKSKVSLIGEGYATLFKSGTGGANSHHIFIYLKDYSSISDCRLSGSEYSRQTGGADFVGYNKIGISTQGATIGMGMRISNVGFEKFQFSHVFVFDNHSNVIIDGCYTYGQQVGQYVDVDKSFFITNWNSTKDNGKLSAGAQVYCLTNFYNSGSNAYDVTIKNGIHTNINDAFVGLNSNCSRHIVSNNIFRKNAVGYYGGWGIDVAGGDNCIATGNYIYGASTGCHLANGDSNTVTGNTFETDRGVWIRDITTTNNTISGNTITMTNGLGAGIQYGIHLDGSQNNNITGNMINCTSTPMAKGVYLTTSALGNALVGNTVSNAATGIEASSSNESLNYAMANAFRNVATNFPVSMNSNHFQNIKGLSGTTLPCNNLSGSVTIVASTTTTAVTFANTEPNINYQIFFSNSLQDLGTFWTNKTTSGFTLNHSSPGFNRVADWFIIRS